MTIKLNLIKNSVLLSILLVGGLISGCANASHRHHNPADFVVGAIVGGLLIHGSNHSYHYYKKPRVRHHHNHYGYNSYRRSHSHGGYSRKSRHQKSWR